MSWRFGLLALAFISALPVSSFAASSKDSRGEVFEFDAGPPLDSKWPDLFAETPNYRGIGQAIMGGKEKFRYEFGPMWYRGRLTPNDVKVFVVGQEGAQDENVSNRSFTGSTGTKMQNFLNAIGITKSYVFMNTFVYTIFGQYKDYDQNPPVTPPDVAWIAQSLDSPIVQHRHKMFDYVLETNKKSLALIIGVGAAGKDSVVTWVQAKAKEAGLNPNSTCPYIENCDASFLGKDIRVIGLVHPGGASALNGGEGQGSVIKKDFDSKFALVKKWASGGKWLPSDEAGFKIGSFKYANAVVPYRDFAFGTVRTMGLDGTASNRKDKIQYGPGKGAYYSIQIQSSNGCYNATVKKNGRCTVDKKDELAEREPISYKQPEDMMDGIAEMTKVDVPWEPPKSVTGRREFDPGPATQDLAKALTGAVPGYQWPDFAKLGVTVHESFGQGPIYRGRLQNAQVLVLADQQSQDDLFSTRALTGTGGQKLQTFLNAMGVTESYAVIRTLPVDTLDLTVEQRTDILKDAQVKKALGKILSTVLAEGKTELVLTVGSAAAAYAKSSPELKGLQVINLVAPDADGKSEVTAWKKALTEIKALGLQTEATATFKYDGSLTSIPRKDLPNQTRFWIGTSGTRGARAYNNGAWSGADWDVKPKGWDPDYYKVYVPTWVFEYPTLPLTVEENAAVQSFLKQ